MSLTEEELEVAVTLDSLPELVLASVHRAALHVLPESLRWGSRKPRSLPGHPLMPSPPPPLRYGEKNVDGGVTATATSSPSTPLSFQGSGGSEDIDVRPKPWVEHSKQYIQQWMEEQHEPMASFADKKANLERVREEYEAHLHSPSANPSVLPAAAQLRHIVRRRVKQMSRRQEKMLWVGGGDMVAVDRTAVDHRWAESGSQRPAAGRVGLPDLNVTPDDEEGGWDLVWGWGERQHSACKAAMSALARRRRLQIQKAKRYGLVYDQ
ncbi:unnamed protein product [Musa acuminata subsp. malaccensis]|uniref:(wild Malaysian banana) hypothetical protein n=1 Tax=Musa acuminata subsp. malaccensis TaxID=214687 RepID=A0A8D7FJT1_MUSAM|nr:unnamed protein product [Musa acuminata subsp. malaccensis]